MRNNLFVVSLIFLLAACASQGQKSADIEQRDLFDQQQQAAKQQAAKQQDAERQAKIAKEQEELKRQLDEQQRRQQGQGDQAIVKPLPGTGVGGSQLRGDAWAQLKEPGTPLAKRSVYYEYNRYDIKEEYVPVIEAHGKFLMDHNDLKIAVQGNCDDRGSREYNLALGQRRAESVKRAMVLLGVGDKQIETVSFGAEKPMAMGQDEDSWAKNRRADIVYPNEPQ
jgi:peptidoglycan-associated lipoprotein